MSERLAVLGRRLGYEFKDSALFERALAHSSWAAENGAEDNERLEFLGDAVLGLAVSDMLMARFADAGTDEGGLSRIRSSLVSGPALARAAAAMDLGEVLLLGRGELAGGGQGKESILEGAFEAVIGAVFLDGGYAAARALVEREFGPLLEGGPPPQLDPKSELQERLAALGHGCPEYVVSTKSGPEHMPTYEVEVREGSRVLANGRGGSRRAAEREAAGHALEKLAGES